jgi:sec-independent protein translocase protein TatB
MLDFGWSELLLIMALAVLVIGPDEIPKIMMTLGRIMRRIQYVRYAFSQQFEDFMKAADLDDINKQVNFEARAPQEATFDEAELDGETPQEPASQKEDAA